MSKVRIVLEAAKSLHPMAVHAYPSEKGKFTVHATGSKVEHVKKGDTVSSSDLDDLSDAGHKVKEIKRPMSEGREGMYQRFEKQGMEIRKKRAEAAQALADADKKSRENAKANEDYDHKAKEDHDEITHIGSGATRKKEKAKWKRWAKDANDVAVTGMEGRKEGKKIHEEQIDEKLTPEAKSAVKQALGPRTPGNEMRKGTSAARTLISVLKTNKKNVAQGTK